MTTRWFEEPFGLMATEEPGRPVLTGPAGAWSCSCGARGFGASREDAEVAVRVHRRSSLCTAGKPRRTRMRKTAPSLHDLRQAYLDAGSGLAAGEALLAFLAALDAAGSEADLDDAEPVRSPPDPAVQVGALVCVVLGLLAWYGLIAAFLTGSLVVLWAVGVPAAAAAWVLGRVATARRHRDG